MYVSTISLNIINPHTATAPMLILFSLSLLKAGFCIVEWSGSLRLRYIYLIMCSLLSLCVVPASQEYNQLHSCSADRAPWHLDGAGLFHSRSCYKLTG